MAPDADPAIRLYLKQPLVNERLKFQWLFIELTRSDRLISPEDFVELQLPLGIDTTGGVVISGRAPVWLYAYLVHELHPTSWIACYDPRMGAVVVAAHSRQVQIGQVIAVEPPRGETHHRLLCPALMVVGPPDSGKSVLSHALFQALLPENPNVYLQRAHWDGEGNYLLDLGPKSTDAERETFKAANRGELTEQFFPYQAQAILNLRRQKSLVIVDVGGMVQPEKQPMLEACTHYLIISSQPEAVDSWHEFCRDRGNLTPVAVIRSTLENCEVIKQHQPFLEITCGPWVWDQKVSIPVILLECFQKLIQSGKF
ncbi:MAG: hypothetical protein NVS2B14_09970 [Chamaesiphon sp.]